MRAGDGVGSADDIRQVFSVAESTGFVAIYRKE